jgi:hypothetical protein
VADDQERPVADDGVDQAEQDLHDVVTADDRLGGRGAAHAGQVRVDAPVPGAVGEHRLQGAGQFAMIHVHAVQPQDGDAGALLQVVHRDAVDHGLQVSTSS